MPKMNKRLHGDGASVAAPKKSSDSNLPKFSHVANIFESIPVGIICADKEGVILEINQGLRTLLGFREDELIGRQTDFLYTDSKPHGHLDRILFNLEGKHSTESFETTVRRKDGTVIPVEIIGTLVKDDKGKELCCLMVIHDISASKTLENNLRQMEQKFRTVANFAYDWVFWRLLDGRMLYVSPSCERITGYTVEQFMDNPSLFRQIMVPEDRQIWDAYRKHPDNIKVDLREFQFRIIRRDGELRWIEHAAHRVISDDNEVIGFRSSNRDITKRKKIEEELRQSLLENLQYKALLEAESAYLKEEINLNYAHEHIVGSSDALQYVLFKINQIAPTDTSVLLLGETGTGKELFARTIHTNSAHRDRPLIKVNCATLPENLIESELFGHEKGSFTGAHTRRIGRFELADKGTIFLDEIGEIPLDLQAKLLRVLQEGEFERIGGSRSVRVNVRVITATNRDLEADIRNGRFRQDLWYRLNVFPITAPPLRERIGDIPQLVRHFVEIFSRKLRKDISAIPVTVMTQLESYHWPGNVRELQNVIERAVLNTYGSRLVLAEELKRPQAAMETPFKSLEEMERDHITRILEKTNWKVSGKGSAAEILGLKRSTLRAKMDKHGIRRS